MKMLRVLPLIFVSASIVNAEQSGKDKFIMAITSAHTRTFSKENLITERISLEDSNVWNSLMNEIAKYVQGTLLMADFEQLQNVSNELLNTLKIVYGSKIAPAIIDAAKKDSGVNISIANASTKIDKAKIKADAIRPLIDPLKIQEEIPKKIPTSIDATIKKYEAQLDSKWFSFGKDKEIARIKEIAEVLKRLALTLEVTIAKVFKDFQKLEKFVQAK